MSMKNYVAKNTSFPIKIQRCFLELKRICKLRIYFASFLIIFSKKEKRKRLLMEIFSLRYIF